MRVRVHVRFHKLKGILLFLPHSSGQYLLQTWLQLSGDVGLKVCAAVCQIDPVCAFKRMCVCVILCIVHKAEVLSVGCERREDEQQQLQEETHEGRGAAAG